MGVDDRGNGVVVHHRLVAGDALRRHDSLLRSLVRQHGAAHDVAHGIDVGRIGDAKVVDEQEAAFVEIDAAVGCQEALGVGAAAHGDDQSIHLQRMFAVGILIGHHHRFALHLGAGDAGAETNVESLATELTQRIAGDAGVRRWQEILQGFENHHFRTEATPNAAEFEARSRRRRSRQDAPARHRRPAHRWNRRCGRRPSGAGAISTGTEPGASTTLPASSVARFAFVRFELHPGTAQQGGHGRQGGSRHCPETACQCRR